MKHLFFLFALGTLSIIFLFAPRKVSALTCTNCSADEVNWACTENASHGCTNGPSGGLGQDGGCNYDGTPGSGEHSVNFSCNSGYYCTGSFSCASLSACDGRGWIDVPATGTTFYKGGIYTIAGWSRFCGGPGGQGTRDRQDFKICSPVGTTTTCTPITSYRGGFSRPDIKDVCWAGTTNTAGWTYDWTVPLSLTSGSYTLWSTSVNDPGGSCQNALRSDITIATDTTLPTINSVTFASPSPYNSEFVTASPVTITTNVTDTQSGLNTVQMSVNSDTNGLATGTWNDLPICNANGVKTAFNCTQSWSTGVSDGKHLIRIITTDKGGNTNIATPYYARVFVDRTKPTYASLTISPTSPAYTSQPVISININDSASGTNFVSGVRLVNVYYSSHTDGTYALVDPWVFIGSCSNDITGQSINCTLNWPANGLSGTKRYVAVNVQDFAGNWRYWSMDLAGNGNPDNAAPNGHTVYEFSANYVCN